MHEKRGAMIGRLLVYAIIIVCVLFILCAIYSPNLAFSLNPWTFPQLPSPDQYGNVLMNRTSAANSVKSVGFSHWSHRLHYTCKVCHLDLGFEMKVNDTEVTEEDNLQGRYCGACHNGKIAFGHTPENCEKCHSGTLEIGRTKFSDLARFPKTPYGNKIDWVSAVYEKLIQPKQSLNGEQDKTMSFTKKLSLESRWTGTPPAIFPHEPHQLWLDCMNCHPDIFNIKQKGTKHFEMNYILQGKFCGACHLKVAFPLDDCRRCHPKMK